MKNIYIFLTSLFLILSTQTSAIAISDEQQARMTGYNTELTDFRADLEKKDKEQGFKKYEYAGYYGQVNKRGNPAGLGVFEYTDGGTYFGQVKNGKPHGTGAYLSPSPEFNIFVGKFNYSNFFEPIAVSKALDGFSSVRSRLRINPTKPKIDVFQGKGMGALSGKWFEVKLDADNSYELTEKGKNAFDAAARNLGNATDASDGSGATSCGSECM
jgi:hypothetical protein